MNYNQMGNDIDGEAAGDNSGWNTSLSADGKTLAIGAINNDGNGSNSGHVRVFTWSGVAWVQRGSDLNGEAAADNSGYGVSLSADGMIVATSAVRNNSNGTYGSGNTRVYAWNGTTWVQRGSDIDPPQQHEYTSLVSLSADGMRLVKSGTDYDDYSTYLGSNVGVMRVYAYDGSTWNQLGQSIVGEGENDFFGNVVKISADGNIVAGSSSGNDGNGSNSGHVRVYTWNGSSWAKRGNDLDGEAAGDQSSSFSMSSDGSIVAIGSGLNGGGRGHVRVYVWNGSSWVQRGNDIDGELGDALSGPVLSANGNLLVVSVSNNTIGSSRIYIWNGTSWVRSREPDIVGEAIGDYSVVGSISADGNIIAMQSTGNDGNGIDSGHVRVYEYNISKSLVGLSNVDNTSDANKPVSSAQQIALNLKAPLILQDFVSDTAAATGGIAIYALYRTGDVIKMRTV